MIAVVSRARARIAWGFIFPQTRYSTGTETFHRPSSIPPFYADTRGMAEITTTARREPEHRQ